MRVYTGSPTQLHGARRADSYAWMTVGTDSVIEKKKIYLEDRCKYGPLVLFSTVQRRKRTFHT